MIPGPPRSTRTAHLLPYTTLCRAGDTGAVTGGVARPGIYELRGSATVGAILDYAGGAVRPRGSSVSISRINSDGGEAFVQVTGVEQQIIAGDALVVASERKSVG